MKILTSLSLVLSLSLSLAAPGIVLGQQLQTTPGDLLLPGFSAIAPGEPGTLYRAGLTGEIYRRTLRANGAARNELFLDLSDEIISGGEAGLLGLAFDPRFRSNRYFYVAYTDDSSSGALQLVVSRFRAGPTGSSAVKSSEKVLIRIDRPQTNHIAGWIGFRPSDPDSLFIASGDGGGANDEGEGHIEPGGNAQNRKSLLGKILRIDIRSDDFPGDDRRNYGIPSNNPFATGGGAQEIWAFGLRNPYRCSFDRRTGDLWIGDVGQSSREEVDFEPAGSRGGVNYGWRAREGSIQNPAFNEPRPRKAVDPIYEYGRDAGFSVIGGYRYRGKAIPRLAGRYIFADFGGSLFSLTLSGGKVSSVEDLSSLVQGMPIALGEDSDGELYLTDLSGNFYKLVP